MLERGENAGGWGWQSQQPIAAQNNNPLLRGKGESNKLLEVTGEKKQAGRKKPKAS
jgi:hypothetical protein